MDFDTFKSRVLAQFGLNLDGYKEKQLKRRIDTLMATLQVPGYAEYLRLLIENKEMWNRFLDRITINVSEFFRNPDIFQVLERQVLPSLLEQRGRLKVWSAACSNGCEPYSLAIILAELSPLETHRIEATDIDRKILEVAKRAVYDAGSLKNVSPARLQRYFEPEGNGYRLKETLKQRVDFRYHDLLTQAYGKGYDLIVCRNVTIYFTADVQRRMYRQFYEALNPGGVLFIGATESILQYQELGFRKISPWFYGKPQGA